jgi:hypothetical protein
MLRIALRRYDPVPIVMMMAGLLLGAILVLAF